MGDIERVFKVSLPPVSDVSIILRCILYDRAAAQVFVAYITTPIRVRF